MAVALVCDEDIHDPAVVRQWREEIVQHDRAKHDELWGGDRRFELYMPGGAVENHEGKVKWWPRDPITDAQIKYVFDELLHVSKSNRPRIPWLALFTASSCISIASPSRLIESGM